MSKLLKLQNMRGQASHVLYLASTGCAPPISADMRGVAQINTLNSTSAREFVTGWRENSNDLLKLTKLRLVSAESPAQILSGWYETENLLIDFRVWENTCCLDIEVMDKESKQFVFSEQGPCGDIDGLAARLQQFSQWISTFQKI